MKRLALLFFILTLPAAVLAQQDGNAFNARHFPLDKDIAWYYDDGTVERIVSFTALEISPGVKAHVFGFDNYRHAPRRFYHVGGKVYEWTGFNRRLWYDFTAQPGDTWKMGWSMVDSLLGPEDSLLADILDGAEVTLISDNETVTVPAGVYEGCYHFQFRRLDSTNADTGIIDEWLAPGVGCVMRSWVTVAGVKEQKLVRHTRPDTEVLPLRMDVKLDFDVYRYGDDINIEVSILNWSDQDIIREFPNALVVDYQIDDEYWYSDNHAFTEQIIQVTFPARDVVKYTFTHTPEDFSVQPGRHVITAVLTGTDISARQPFAVTAGHAPLPEDLELVAQTGKDVYGPGETIDFSLTATNIGETDITLNIVEDNPLKYTFNNLHHFPDPIKEIPGTVEVVIPPGESMTWDGAHDADTRFLPAGSYLLHVGLWGYVGMTQTTFTVSRDLVFGQITGFVFDGSTDSDPPTPLVDAKIRLWMVLPRAYESEMLLMPNSDQNLWATVSDETGAFVLDNVPVGAYYALEIRKDGYLPYHRTFRMLEETMDIQVFLNIAPLHPVTPLNFKRRNVDGIVVTIGTGRSIYRMSDEFRALFRITNTTPDTVTFGFDSDTYVAWSLVNADGLTIWELGNEQFGKPAAEWTVILAPRESRDYVETLSFDSIVPQSGGKFELHGMLMQTSCSIDTIEPGDLTEFVKVLVLPLSIEPVMERIEVRAHGNEFYVDLRDSLRAEIDMLVRADTLSGEFTITELRENLHQELSEHRFHRMIEIDADARIRASMDSALVRIYFDPDEVDDPTQLVIAHWRDNVTWNPDDIGSVPPEDLAGWETGDLDGWDADDFVPNADQTGWNAAAGDYSGSTDWTVLPSRIDHANHYVEAYTASFSSFGLFEASDEPTIVDDDTPASFTLAQNFPNPFNPSTTISFTLPADGLVKLTVYNMLGQEVIRLVEDVMHAGTHQVVFDGSNLASGIYFYRIFTQQYTETRKMLLIK